jgi:hypothetical protein
MPMVETYATTVRAPLCMPADETTQQWAAFAQEEISALLATGTAFHGLA